MMDTEARTESRTAQMNWDRMTPIIARNNMAVSLMQEGRYTEARSLLSSALFELQDQIEDSTIMMSPFQVHNGPTTSANDGPRIDDWMADSPRPLHLKNLYMKDTTQNSFYLYQEGIRIPTLPADHKNIDSALSYKYVSFVVFFNQGLAHHLPSLKKSSGTGSTTSDDETRRQMASTAHELYRLALQYRNEHQSSLTASRFLLAICNNLAVLDYQWNPPSTDKTGCMSPYFEYLKMLLGSSSPSVSSTREEVKIWNRCCGNILLAITWFHSRKSNHASAA